MTTKNLWEFHFCQTHHCQNTDQSRFCQESINCYCSSFSPKARYSLGHCHVGRQTNGSNQFLMFSSLGFLAKPFHIHLFWKKNQWIKSVFDVLFRFSCKIFFVYTFVCPPKFSVPDESPQQYTSAAIFHCGNNVLWSLQLSFIPPNIIPISVTQDL